jgi:hypothetical protein
MGIPVVLLLVSCIFPLAREEEGFLSGTGSSPRWERTLFLRDEALRGGRWPFWVSVSLPRVCMKQTALCCPWHRQT